MRIRTYSDLHLDSQFNHTGLYDPDSETHGLWVPPSLPHDKETILCLAGDLWVGTKWIEYLGFSWISAVASKFKQVLVVNGNHDLWSTAHGLTIVDAARKCNDMLVAHDIHNVTVLDCDTVEIDDVLFVGATLWTDMHKGDPLTMYNMKTYMKSDGNIKYRTGPSGQYERFTSAKWIQTHATHAEYIRQVASANPNKKVVIITHHQPVTFVGDPLYEGHPSNGYYSSDLSDIMLANENIAMWNCGHSHHTVNERFNKTLLYCNPVGYQFESRERMQKVLHHYIDV